MAVGTRAAQALRHFDAAGRAARGRLASKLGTPFFGLPRAERLRRVSEKPRSHRILFALQSFDRP